MLEKAVKLIDLDENKEDTWDNPDSFLKKFDYKKASLIFSVRVGMHP